MTVTRENHYVPEWYQKGFFIPGQRPSLFYLDFIPKRIALPNGQEKVIDQPNYWAPARCFKETDLYTTSLFGFLSDEIERLLFGPIDSQGAAAIRAFVENDQRQMHSSYPTFFEYMDAQKLRTPKGLAWINAHYRTLNHKKLLLEMQHIRQLNCTVWAEAVREIVSAKNSNTKFIVSDHPVTVYNPACAQSSDYCKFPNDPPISLLGSQTIFPLNADNCLILTNLEYAQDFDRADPLRSRTNPRSFSQTLIKTDAMIRTRFLTEPEVRSINFILKSRAARHIAAAEKEWLYPEKQLDRSWEEFAALLRPPKNELWNFGGEI